jgi:regulatory protein SWI6
MLSVNAGATDLHEKRRIGYADAEGAGILIKEDDLPYELRQAGDHLSHRASEGKEYLSTPIPLDPQTLAQVSMQPQYQTFAVQQLPPSFVLKHRLESYSEANHALLKRSRMLKEKDGQLEQMYRKVVSLCTKVEEGRIEECLEGLVAALDSEEGEGVEVGRVREFLRKVEGVE